MDFSEKAVIRRKARCLKEVLKTVDAQLLFKECLLQGLITSEEEQRIKEIPNADHMTNELLLALENNGISTFHKICFLFSRLHHEWIADELRLELTWDKGWLDTEGYVQHEARVLAQKIVEKHGLRNKKDICDEIWKLASGRYQVAKETWKQQVTKKQKNLTSERKIIEKDVADIYERLIDMMEELDILSSDDIQFARQMDNGPGVVLMLRETLTKMEESWQREVIAREKLNQERQKCLELLNERDRDADLRLTLEGVLGKCQAELGQTRAEIKSKSEISRSLDQQIRGLRMCTARQIQEKERQMERLRKDNADKDSEIQNYVVFIRNMKEKNNVVEAQLAHWRQRCELLEKTRRLGYYYRLPASGRDSAERLWQKAVESVLDRKEAGREQNQSLSTRLKSLSRSQELDVSNYSALTSEPKNNTKPKWHY